MVEAVWLLYSPPVVVRCGSARVQRERKSDARQLVALSRLYMCTYVHVLHTRMECSNRRGDGGRRLKTEKFTRGGGCWVRGNDGRRM